MPGYVLSYNKQVTPSKDESGKLSPMDYAQLIGATTLRVGAPIVGAGLGALTAPFTGPVGAIAGGASGGAIGEYLAEKVEPEAMHHGEKGTNWARVGINAALGGVPGGAIVRTGKPLASAGLGAGLGYASTVADKTLAQNEDLTHAANPATWTKGELIGTGLSAVVGGAFGKMTGGGPRGKNEPIDIPVGGHGVIKGDISLDAADKLPGKPVAPDAKPKLVQRDPTGVRLSYTPSTQFQAKTKGAAFSGEATNKGTNMPSKTYDGTTNTVQDRPYEPNEGAYEVTEGQTPAVADAEQAARAKAVPKFQTIVSDVDRGIQQASDVAKARRGINQKSGVRQAKAENAAITQEGRNLKGRDAFLEAQETEESKFAQDAFKRFEKNSAQHAKNLEGEAKFQDAQDADTAKFAEDAFKKFQKNSAEHASNLNAAEKYNKAQQAQAAKDRAEQEILDTIRENEMEPGDPSVVRRVTAGEGPDRTTLSQRYSPPPKEEGEEGGASSGGGGGNSGVPPSVKPGPERTVYKSKEEAIANRQRLGAIGEVRNPDGRGWVHVFRGGETPPVASPKPLEDALSAEEASPATPVDDLADIRAAAEAPIPQPQAPVKQTDVITPDELEALKAQANQPLQRSTPPTMRFAQGGGPEKPPILPGEEPPPAAPAPKAPKPKAPKGGPKAGKAQTPPVRDIHPNEKAARDEFEAEQTYLHGEDAPTKGNGQFKVDVQREAPMTSPEDVELATGAKQTKEVKPVETPGTIYKTVPEASQAAVAGGLPAEAVEQVPGGYRVAAPPAKPEVAVEPGYKPGGVAKPQGVVLENTQGKWNRQEFKPNLAAPAVEETAPNQFNETPNKSVLQDQLEQSLAQEGVVQPGVKMSPEELAQRKAEEGTRSPEEVANSVKMFLGEAPEAPARVYKGDAGQFFTFNDEKAGYPKTREALAGYDDAQLKKAYNESLKDSLNPMWPAAKKMLKLVEEEAESRGLIARAGKTPVEAPVASVDAVPEQPATPAQSEVAPPTEAPKAPKGPKKGGMRVAPGTGARMATAEGSAKVEAAKQQMRDVINSDNLDPKARADAIEAARNAVHQAETDAHVEAKRAVNAKGEAPPAEPVVEPPPAPKGKGKQAVAQLSPEQLDQLSDKERFAYFKKTAHVNDATFMERHGLIEAVPEPFKSEWQQLAASASKMTRAKVYEALDNLRHRYGAYRIAEDITNDVPQLGSSRWHEVLNNEKNLEAGNRMGTQMNSRIRQNMEVHIKNLGERLLKDEGGFITPGMAFKMLMTAGGATAGAAMSPDDPIAGAILGGGAGLGLSALAPNVVGQLIGHSHEMSPDGQQQLVSNFYKTLKTGLNLIPDWQRFSMLAHPINLPINAVLGPWGSAIMGALEHTVAQDPRGAEALKKLLDPRNFAREYRAARSSGEAAGVIEQSESRAESHLSEAPAWFQHMTELPAAHMTAGDIAAKRILLDAGFTEEEARRITLTSEPYTPPGRGIAAFKKGAQTEGGKKSWLVNMMMPFYRTAVNQFEQGAERTPLFGLFAQGFKDVPDEKRLRVAQQLVGTGAAGMAFMAGLAAPNNIQAQRYMLKIINNVGGQYGVPMSAAFMAGQAFSQGKDAAQSVFTEESRDMPLPTARPAKDLFDFATGKKDENGNIKVPPGLWPQVFNPKVPLSIPSVGGAILDQVTGGKAAAPQAGGGNNYTLSYKKDQ